MDKGVGMCLFNMPEVKVLYGGQKCGNGYVEEGEECDCGEPEVSIGALTQIPNRVISNAVNYETTTTTKSIMGENTP